MGHSTTVNKKIEIYMGDFTNSKPLSSSKQTLLWHVVSEDLSCTTFISSAGNVCKKISSGKSSVILLISNKKELDLLIPEILSALTAWNFKYWQDQNFDLWMIVLLCVEQRAKGHEEGGFQCARDLRDEGWERAISGWRKNIIEARLEESQIVIKMKFEWKWRYLHGPGAEEPETKMSA